jgi:copper oxidase (laccase) domain-containing protein
MVLATATDPTVTHHTAACTIATFDGKQAPLPSALAFASQHQASIEHLVSPPNSATQSGFQQILTNPKSYELKADGILLVKKQTVGIWSRDCPIVVIMDAKRGEMVVCHAGRPAMTPHHHLANRNYTIITAAVYALTSRGSVQRDLSAYITGGICKDCFKHDIAKDAAILAPFKRRFPAAVSAAGALDLVGIIVAELLMQGLGDHTIVHDRLCTKEHGRLASKRGGDGPSSSNLTLVIPNRT